MDGMYYIRGKAYYAKVLGEPVKDFDKTGHEWTLEIEPDKEGRETLEGLGLSGLINKGENEDRIRFSQRYERRDGKVNRPIQVTGPDNKPWDQNTLIGNGSVIDLKFNFKDYGKGKKPGRYPVAIRVLEHVPYVRNEFAPLREDDPHYKPPKVEDDFKKDFDIEDEVVE